MIHPIKRRRKTVALPRDAAESDRSHSHDHVLETMYQRIDDDLTDR